MRREEGRGEERKQFSRVLLNCKKKATGRDGKKRRGISSRQGRIMNYLGQLIAIVPSIVYTRTYEVLGG